VGFFGEEIRFATFGGEESDESDDRRKGLLVVNDGDKIGSDDIKNPENHETYNASRTSEEDEKNQDAAITSGHYQSYHDR
jgi:hypothetical protein